MTTYSYNCGRPVQKVVVPTLAEAINLFDKLRKTGKIFRVDFVKRTNGENRTMVCRFGVGKHTKGGKRRYDACDKGLFLVWDFNKQGYRMITIDNMICLKTGGVVYWFDDSILVANKYDVPVTTNIGDLKGRTLPAFTSPLYTGVEV